MSVLSKISEAIELKKKQKKFLEKKFLDMHHHLITPLMYTPEQLEIRKIRFNQMKYDERYLNNKED